MASLMGSNQGLPLFGIYAERKASFSLREPFRSAGFASALHRKRFLRDLLDKLLIFSVLSSTLTLNDGNKGSR